MIVTYADFGVQGPYLGQMRAAVHAVWPEATVVDLMSDVPAFDIKAAAHLLPAVIRSIAAPCVCLGVVDPGVGSDRRAVALLADDRWYAGPDNGLFSIVASRAEKKQWYEITWRPTQLSASFHGRDLFAPVAAKIAMGAAPDIWGAKIPADNVVTLGTRDELCEVIYIDGYGNCMTGIRASALSEGQVIDWAGQSLTRARTFSDVSPGSAFCYKNSLGLMEIALRGGNAALSLSLEIGSQVSVRNL